VEVNTAVPRRHSEAYYPNTVETVAAATATDFPKKQEQRQQK
jgi:hypothetical protein